MTDRPASQRGIVRNLLMQLLTSTALLLALPLCLRMSPENFWVLLRPASLRFLLFGVATTATVSLLAASLSIPLATALALGRSARILLLRWPCAAVVEVVRAVPLLLLIFYINLSVPAFAAIGNTTSSDYLQIELGRLFSRESLAMVVALTIYTAAVNAEVIRSGIRSISSAQVQAGRALGLTERQTLLWVTLPQALHLVMVPILSQFTILIKDTSLGAIIGFVELQRRIQILYQRDLNPLEALYSLAILYFALNYVIKVAIDRVEHRHDNRAATLK